MTEKERDANEMVEEILRQLKEKRESGEMAHIEPERAEAKGELPPRAIPQAAPPPAAQRPQAAPPPAAQRPQAAPPPAAQRPQAAPPPAAQKPQPVAPVEELRPAREEIFPEPRLTELMPRSGEELIDEQFTKFFTQSITTERPVPREKKKGLFARLFGKGAEDDEYEEEDEEDEDDTAGFEPPAPTPPEKPALPKDLFATEPVPAPAPAPAPLTAEPVPPTAIPEPCSPKPKNTASFFGEENLPQPEPPVARPAPQPVEIPQAAPAPQPVQMPQAAPAQQPVQMPQAAPAPQPEVSQPAPQPEFSQPAPAPAPQPVAEAVPDELPTKLYEGAEPEAVAASSRASIFEADGLEAVAEASAPSPLPEEPEEPTQEHKIPPLAPPVFEEDEEEEPEEIRDYDSPEDAAAVLADLRSLKANLTLRFTITSLITVFLLYITLAKSYPILPTLPILSPTGQPLVYLIVCFVLTLLCLAVNWQTVAGGVSSIAKEPNPDLAPAFAGLFAAIQCAVFFTDPAKFAAGSHTVFCGIAALTLAANTLGKKLTARIVLDNFEMASTGFDHSAAYCVENEELTKKVTAGLGETEPHLLVSRPTALVKGFLRQSFSEHRSDKLAKMFGIAAIAASVVCGVAVFVTTKDLFSAVSCFAGAMCLGAPLASTLVGAIPAGLMQSSAARVGAIIPGPSAVQALRDTNVVMMNARDLFPTGTVMLRGIKTFEKERIDLAILYAASILVEGCETLRDVFLDVVAGKREMLYPVENLVCETGRGFVGWIEGNRVIVGNREIMKAHEIEIPSMDYERKYTKDEKSPIYLAVSGKLFGMFLVSYLPVEEMQDTLDELRHTGLSLLVRSTDFNVSSTLIARCYGVPLSSVKVLSEAELAALTPSLSYLPASEGVMTHIGSFSSFIGGLRAALSASAAEHTAAIVEGASVLLALVITALLTLTAGLGHLSVFAVLLYQLAWLILTVAVPLLKKY